MKKKAFKKPNFILYYLLMGILVPYVKLRNNVHFYTKETKKIQEPCLIISNHPSAYDFICASQCTPKKRLTIIMAKNFMYVPILGSILKKIRVITKSLFSPDTDTMKQMLKCVKSGGSILLFPESRLSSCGELLDIPAGTDKLIKKLGITVISCHIEGAYFTAGKWTKSKRRGRVNVTSKVLFTKEETQKLSTAEISERINKALYYNEYKWIEKNPNLRYKGKSLTSGLNNLLYKCPNCGKEFVMNSEGNHYICSSCRSDFELSNRYYFSSQNSKVVYHTIIDWYNYQKEEALKEVKNDFILKTEVILKMPVGDKNKRMRVVGEGTCMLSQKGLEYVGVINNKRVALLFPIHLMPTLLFGCGEDFEIYYHNEFYYFMPKENLAQCAKWSIFTEAAFQLNKENQEG